MMSFAARLFFYLWDSSLERHSEALLQSDTWARIEGCFPWKTLAYGGLFDAFFWRKLDGIRFTDCCINEGQRRGKRLQ